MQASPPQNVPIAEAIEENAQERINFSGELRMLSQRIPSAACHLDRGIAVESARALLEGATAEFEQILAALEFGDEDLNIIMPETRRKSLARIHELRALWGPFKAAADVVVAGTESEAAINYLLNENLAVLSAAQLVVEELVKQYSNPNAATRASLMLIDISGRQRMLTQKMSKETCTITGTHHIAETLEALGETARIFEASLHALRFGMPSVGVGPPPTAEISAGLAGVLEDWDAVKPFATEVLAGGDLDNDDHARKFMMLNITMSNMNTVVGMYTGAARPNS
ncbi:type IV pili methyl-accepting chemotaxis transducer N-terminal domain-containing protein [Yoonia sp. GPGPB17]|uniref:type IV pili methyl-accepting chemotaxis transducer N-terminal domain-containing protein n=1 Tax=Yoonia sp. GPGPB17 TaxID=3026147 RepID=UPI0030BC56F1